MSQISVLLSGYRSSPVGRPSTYLFTAIVSSTAPCIAIITIKVNIYNDLRRRPGYPYHRRSQSSQSPIHRRQQSEVNLLNHQSGFLLLTQHDVPLRGTRHISQPPVTVLVSSIPPSLLSCRSSSSSPSSPSSSTFLSPLLLSQPPTGWI